MKIRFFALFLCILLLPVFAVQAADSELEHIKNGDFEVLGKDLMPIGWSSKNGSVNSGIIIETKDTPKGSGNALKIAPEGTAIYVSQPVKTLIPGESYTFSAKLRILENEDNRTAVKFEFTDAADDSFWLKFSKSDAAKWTDITHTFVYPKKATRLSVMLRNTSTGGEILWDDISLTGPGDAAVVEDSVKLAAVEEDIYVDMPAFAEELLTNESMEAGTGGGITGWKVSDEKLITGTSEAARTGSRSAKITWASGNPYLVQGVDNITPGATYQASFWYKIESTGTTKPGFKMEWYNGDTYINGVWVKDAPIQVKTEEWNRYTMHFTVPAQCNHLSYYIRLYTEGVCYFDDASLYMIKEPPVIAAKLTTDQVFYYSDISRGTAFAEANLDKFPGTVSLRFSLTGTEGNIAEETMPLDADGCATFGFDVGSLMETKEGEEPHAYTLRAECLDADGKVLGSNETPVLRYPRPAILGRDGTVKIEGGKPFHPVFAYHVKAADLGRVGEVGINTVRSYGADAAALKTYLDEADKYGLKVLVSLYPNMKPAGHPDNVENTTKVITTLKDHPALLAWMVMDEVFSYFPDRTDLLYDSYTLIRKLDMTHPVYMLQNSTSQFEVVEKYTDILAFDPYPSVAENLAETVAADSAAALAATAFGKPVWCLNKAYTLTAEPNPKERPLPTIMEERSLWYQTLFAGTQAVGFFSFSDSIQEPTTPLYNTPLWEGLCTFAEEEMEESYRYFVDGAYPVFGGGETEDFRYSAYVKDGKVRVIILNRHESEKTASVPLVSDGDAVKIGAFSAKRIYGGDDTVTGDGTLSVTMEPSAAYVYEITPASDMDFSPLSKTKFRDLAGFPWANNAIRNLGESGVIYGTTPISYAPGTKISRGDFAAFLINTLGLTADSADTFADVRNDYPFADAIRIGKALGILKGVGDNRFNPHAEISRQDMMVICARGMRLAKELDTEGNTEILNTFSDKDLIADYAALDVAAMIRSSIIKGNADGTINPVGNATRAETAVIMQRIQAWKDAL